VIRIARNISRNLSRNLSRTVGTEPDLVLDSYSGASAAYSLYDLGNKRGTVVETEATYHNPAVRLRRDSDNTHKSFPGGAFTPMLNWANEDVELIGIGNNNGDFEDTLNDWSVSAGVSHDTVEFYAGTGSAKMTVTAGGAESIAQALLVVGNEYSCTFWAKISDASKTFRCDLGTGNLNVISPATTEWTQYTVTGVCSGSSSFRFFRGSTSGDYTVNFDNVVLTQLTSNAYAATWYDQSGSDNDSTQTTADSQPKVVTAGTLVTDANGNYALDFDGVDDYFNLSSAITYTDEFCNYHVFETDTLSFSSLWCSSSGAAPRTRITSGTNVDIVSNTGSTLDSTVATIAIGSVHILAISRNSSDIAVATLDASAGTTGSVTGNFTADQLYVRQTSTQPLNGRVVATLMYPVDRDAGVEEILSNTIKTALS
jgi:hypothetical protein